MDEYVEREALMRQIKEIHCADCNSYHGVRCRACLVDDTLGYIESEPAADVVPVVHGRWVKVGESCGVNILECSVCHTVHAQDGDTFCRDCGADMRGSNDE